MELTLDKHKIHINHVNTRLQKVEGGKEWFACDIKGELSMDAGAFAEAYMGATPALDWCWSPNPADTAGGQVLTVAGAAVAELRLVREVEGVAVVLHHPVEKADDVALEMCSINQAVATLDKNRVVHLSLRIQVSGIPEGTVKEILAAWRRNDPDVTVFRRQPELPSEATPGKEKATASTAAGGSARGKTPPPQPPSAQAARGEA